MASRARATTAPPRRPCARSRRWSRWKGVRTAAEPTAWVADLIDTDLYRNWVRRTVGEDGISPDTNDAALAAGIALRTLNTTDDVARAALFLASDDARTITGQSIIVDAGDVMVG